MKNENESLSPPPETTTCPLCLEQIPSAWYESHLIAHQQSERFEMLEDLLALNR